ncbi:MAG: GIY-YIG nuclease family protein [Clostridia bacterium]|nr:GIY-YIG nuclease family protein [Clostridia bacterium]
MKYYVYLLKCADESLYVGYTTDLTRRVATHNTGKGAKYTRSRLPVELVYREEFDNEHDAKSREWHLKKLTHKQKLSLIKKI